MYILTFESYSVRQEKTDILNKLKAHSDAEKLGERLGKYNALSQDLIEVETSAFFDKLKKRSSANYFESAVIEIAKAVGVFSGRVTVDIDKLINKIIKQLQDKLSIK